MLAGENWEGRSTLRRSRCWREMTKKMLEDCDMGGEIHTEGIKMLEDWDPGGEIHTDRIKMLEDGDHNPH